MRAIVPVLLMVTAALAVVIMISMDSGQGHGGAQASGSTVVGIDADPFSAPANTATSVGSIEGCVSVTSGQKFSIDVFVDAVPADRDLAGFNYFLIYDSSVLKVTGKNHDMLLKSQPGSNALDLSEAAPDSDGALLVVVADVAPAAAEPGGSRGVLGRYELEAIGSGVAELALDSALLGDNSAQEIPIDSVLSAVVAVDEPCPTASPTPTVSPTATASPTATPTPPTGAAGLVSGWNHICYAGASQSTQDAFSEVGSDVLAVYRLRPDQGYDKWFPSRPDLSTLLALEPYQSLFVLMANSRSWMQDAAASPPASASLVLGWNNACYAGQTKGVEAATADIGGQFAAIYYLRPEQAWSRFLPGRPDLSNLAELRPFTSVLILVTATDGVEWLFDP
jgi:hypothetical protein